MKLKRSEFVNTIKTPLKFHWSMFLLLPFFIWQGVSYGPYSTYWQNSLLGIWYYVVIFGSVLFHEYFHIWEARSQDVYVQDIKLMILGGMARIDGERLLLDRRASLWVSLAGPLGSLILTAVGFVGTMVFNFPYVFGSLFFINLILFVFNLLPLFPMDGGRVFHAILSKFFVITKAHRIASYVSFVVCTILMIVSICFDDFWMAFVFLVLIYFGIRERSIFLMVARKKGIVVEDPKWLVVLKEFGFKVESKLQKSFIYRKLQSILNGLKNNFFK